MMKGLKKQKFAAVFLCIAGVLAIAVWAFKDQINTSSYFIDPQSQELVAHGQAIYSVHCAACHGVNLQGQMNWRQRLSNGRLPAPPHDESGHTWHHPDAQLFDIVQNGLVPGRTAPENYVSDMPAYGDTLSDQDIVAVLAYIKSRWPVAALKAQRTVTSESH